MENDTEAGPVITAFILSGLAIFRVLGLAVFLSAFSHFMGWMAWIDKGL